MTDNYRLAFLFANWYSGATVFNILLNNHSRIVSNGEAFPFRATDQTTYTCSCGQELKDCEFYRAAAGHMFDARSGSWNRHLFAQLPQYSSLPLLNRWLQSHRHAGRLRDFIRQAGPWLGGRHARFVTAHREFFRRSTELANATMYLDGTKSFARAELFTPMTSGTIYLLRDGRGFCNSFRKNRQLPESELATAAEAWLQHLDALEHTRRRHPGIPVLVVRYEDLCRDLSATMAEVCAFLDVPFEDNVLGRQLAPYHLLGNRMRMTFDGTIKEDLSWQTELSSGQIEMISEILRPGLEAHGYI